MKEIDVNNWNRFKTYEWFKIFSNSTYGMNVEMDVTKLVALTKNNNQSFFINLLYIIMNGLNSIDEMRMRYVNNKPVIYDVINPAFTVMTELGTYENVRFKNETNYKMFYEESRKLIDNAKKQLQIKKEDYNPVDCYDEYYITCVPWISFSQLTHPIPDDKSNQCIPRICWGKYTKVDNNYKITLNITVNHMFVDGYHLTNTFKKIQELLDNCEELLK